VQVKLCIRAFVPLLPQSGLRIGGAVALEHSPPGHGPGLPPPTNFHVPHTPRLGTGGPTPQSRWWMCVSGKLGVAITDFPISSNPSKPSKMLIFAALVCPKCAVTREVGQIATPAGPLSGMGVFRSKSLVSQRRVTNGWSTTAPHRMGRGQMDELSSFLR